jgi:excisionase family DNA binding protein
MRTPPARDEVREVMDIRIASDYLGISPDTLYKYASDGFVPAFKLGNRWRFKRSRLDEWMDQQSSQGAQPRKAEAQPWFPARKEQWRRCARAVSHLVRPETGFPVELRGAAGLLVASLSRKTTPLF